MRLIFVRHGEPDYSCDGLTEKGKRDAEILARRICGWDVDRFFCSPLGRAVETAKPTLDALGRTAEIIPWLREYSYPVANPTHGRKSVCWDFVPSDWTSKPEMFTDEDWLAINPASQNQDLTEQYYTVINGFDSILSEYGYTRKDRYYITANPKGRNLRSTVIDNSRHVGNELPDEDAAPTLVFFCHFGVTCLILSHLLNIPFETLTHGFIIPTCGVTILTSEERWEDEAYFRVQAMGDVAHLLNAGEKISGAGAFFPVFQK